MKHTLNQLINHLFEHKIMKILLAIAAYFSPILPLLIAALVFAFCDFLTGIFASRKKALLQGKTNWSDWWESKRLQKKVFDLVFYLLGIILAFYFQKLFFDLIQFPLSRLVSFVILSVEFWSNMENLSVITGLPLNKQSFFEAMNKLRKGGDQTDEQA